MPLDSPVVVLFDIDGTLVRTEGRSRHSRAFLGAFQQVYGVACKFDKEMHGMTDRQIFRELAQALELGDGRLTELTDEACRVMLQLYRLPSEEDGHYVALPGALELLTTLQDLGVTLGLLTGNDPEIAADKLTSAGLAQFFTFGAFGTEADDRTSLPPIAIARAAERLGRELDPRSVFIIGDTHRDVECAVVNGCRAVAVATGHFSMEELAAVGAEVVLPDLRELDPLLRLLDVGSASSDPDSERGLESKEVVP